MKKTLTALAAIGLLSASAFATANPNNGCIGGDCRGSQNAGNGSIANGGEGGTSTSDAYARAQQWQQQQQAQDLSLRNVGNGTGYGGEGGSARIGAGAGSANLGDGVGSATMNGNLGGAGGSGTGGAATAGVNGSGNGNQMSIAPGAIGGSFTQYTDRSRATAWAPVIHGAGAAPLASGTMAVVPGVCGARVDIVFDPVEGRRFDTTGPNEGTKFVQGYSERTVPSKTPFVEFNSAQGTYLLGHSVSYIAATVGTSSAGSFSVGFFGKEGQGGQGGAAASSSHQQLVTKVVVQDCVFAAPTPVALPAAAAVVIPEVKKGRE